jgi:voltage-gated potassium channel Kch
VVVTYADTAAAVRVLSHIHALNPSVPVIVRARDESDIERLTAAGATEVVPEAFRIGGHARLAHAGHGRCAAQSRDAAGEPGAR